jgi:hypothetical protein
MVPGHLVADIDEWAGHETEGRQCHGRGEVADHHVVRGEVHRRRDGPEGDRLRQRTADRKWFSVRLLRLCVPTNGQESGKVDSCPKPTDFAIERRPEIIPGRFVEKIEYRADDQREAGEAGRGGEFADNHEVRAEIQGRDDDRKVMVLATACLIARRGRASFALGAATAGLILLLTAVLNSGRRRRRRSGQTLGASTAAPPIARPGIKAASKRAAPAAIAPKLAAIVTKSCLGPAWPLDFNTGGVLVPGCATRLKRCAKPS